MDLKRQKSKKIKRDFTYKLMSDPKQADVLAELEKIVAGQKDIVEEQQNLLVRHKEVLTHVDTSKSMTTTEIIDYLISTEKIARLCPREFGKMMGILADNYVEELIDKELNIKCVSEEDDTRDGNEAGYDKLVKNGSRLQIKFRGCDPNAKSLYSRGIYFETTRRKSTKNMGEASETGHVKYRDDEFDAVFVILASKDKNKRNRKCWNYSVIYAKDIADGKGYIKDHIPAKVLKEGRNWKDRLSAIC